MENHLLDGEIITRKLEKIQFDINFILEKEFLRDAQVEFIEELMEGRIRASIRAYLYGEHLGSKEVRWPADWWQHFKLRWFPVFLLVRYPVIYERYKFSAYELYPNFKPWASPSFKEVYEVRLKNE